MCQILDSCYTREGERQRETSSLQDSPVGHVGFDMPDCISTIKERDEIMNTTHNILMCFSWSPFWYAKFKTKNRQSEWKASRDQTSKPVEEQRNYRMSVKKRKNKKVVVFFAWLLSWIENRWKREEKLRLTLQPRRLNRWIKPYVLRFHLYDTWCSSKLFRRWRNFPRKKKDQKKIRLERAWWCSPERVI